MGSSSFIVHKSSSRPLADFPSSVWEDRFLAPPGPHPLVAQGSHATLIEGLKEDVKTELTAGKNHIDQQLKLIDSIQRLGVQYHFESEIDRALQVIYENYHQKFKCHTDLYTTSLGFRLLRQHGHQISSDIFDKFKDVNGEFQEHLIDDAMGMLEFYEAAHLGVHGEDILDRGLVFTRAHLLSMLPNLSNPVADQVDHALNNFSVRRGLLRLSARRYISTYEKYASHNESLLKLAKLDYNILQALHKKELSELYRWWKEELEVPKKLSYVRDRLVECYFWILGVYYEPQYSRARIISTKKAVITSVLDDTYDAYGTFEELRIFTESIEKWDSACLDSLPDYTKVLHNIVLQLYEDIAAEMITQGRSYRVPYVKEALKEIAQGYLDEVKWREDKYIPTVEEYMPVAMRTTTYVTMMITSFFGMGDIATKESFDWVISQPDIVRASCVICRLMGDIAAHEFERNRNHIPSAVECYMQQHNASKQEAYDAFKVGYIEPAWKDINQGYLRPTEIPATLLDRILNLTRVIEVLYSKGDWYTHVGPEMQSIINQLFVDPVPE